MPLDSDQEPQPVFSEKLAESGSEHLEREIERERGRERESPMSNEAGHKKVFR